MPYKFYGGVNPAEFKTLTSDKPIKKAYIPKKVILPLSQHTGSPSEAVVSVGDKVAVGQLIAKPSGFISSALHATISGEITGITHLPSLAHPRALSITIESRDDDDQNFNLRLAKDIETISREDLLGKVRDAGIVGLGGAAFPTHVKLSPLKTKTIDSIIINGVECEPYITCDHRIMLEKSKEVLSGVDIVAKILGVKDAYIAIEDNKLSGIYAMERALAAFRPALSDVGIKIVSLKTKYPQGSERQLVKTILNRTVPAGALPMDVGCIAQNIGTVFAIYEAVYLSKPLIERCVTITGPCIRDPLNIWVRIGTVLSDLAGSFGHFIKEPRKVIVGGTMMGIAQYTMDFPVTKGASGVVFLSDEYMDRSIESVCIRCGRCIEACPAGIVPTTLMQYTKKEDFAEVKRMGVEYCFECGSCAYTCPAKIPLLDYMKFGKAKTVSL